MTKKAETNEIKSSQVFKDAVDEEINYKLTALFEILERDLPKELYVRVKQAFVRANSVYDEAMENYKKVELSEARVESFMTRMMMRGYGYK